LPPSRPNVIAHGVDEDATAETQSFLESVQLSDLQNATTWRRLTTRGSVMHEVYSSIG
jgi:hypothetical protein